MLDKRDGWAGALTVLPTTGESHTGLDAQKYINQGLPRFLGHCSRKTIVVTVSCGETQVLFLEHIFTGSRTYPNIVNHLHESNSLEVKVISELEAC
jgi:hypothetical protein